MEQVRLGIIGGRDFTNNEIFNKALEAFREVYEIAVVVSGGANGADKMGEVYAEANGIKKLIFEAEWYDYTPPRVIKWDKRGRQYNALAGFKRNTKIVENSDIILAFWDGKSRGTYDTILKAKTAKVKTIVIRY